MAPRDSSEDTLLRRFQQAAQRDPEAVAVRTGGTAATYGALAAASLSLAADLAPVLAGRTGPVALLMEPGPGQVCAALAAMRREKPYLPIDPSYPRQHIERILADAAPAVLITDIPADVNSGASGSVPADGTVWPGTAGLPVPLRLTDGRWGDSTRVGADDAYVIYTSGSSGTPKGIVIGHRGILNLLDEYSARRELPLRSRYGTCASPGFDAAVLEMWTALDGGGELVVTPESSRWNPGGFTDWLAEEHIAHAYIPAAFLPALARGLRAGRDLRGLRRVIVAVEPIPRGLLGEIKRALPALTLINGYGPTEAAVCVSMYEVSERDEGTDRAPIGTAVRATDLLVEPLAAEAEPEPARDQPVPARPGGRVRGELHIGGVQVGRYIRPETGERPAYYWRAAPDGTRRRYFRTGDVVAADADGVLTFLGRTDDMVKVRGYRVEPGEVERALLDQPGCDQAVVLKQRITHASGEDDAERLVAHVVPTAGARLIPSEIRTRLRERLPWYEVPHQIIVRDGFPLTGHGKIDRGTLAREPAPPRGPSPAGPRASGAPAEATGPDVPVAGDTEARHLWHDLLPASAPDPAASFLANGGDSLTAGRMAAALSDRFGRHVRMLDVLLATGLDELRDIVRRAPVRSTTKAAHGLVPRAAARTTTVPATNGQRGLWFQEMLRPDGVVYNEPLLLRLRGPLDSVALRRALDTIVQRHEALRTGLVQHGTELRQSVRPPEPLRMTVHNLGSVPRDRRRPAEEGAVRDIVRQPFDLASGPHLRAELLRHDDEEHLLVLALHHSAFDGGSADVLFEELTALYTAYTTGEDAELPPPAGQYADFALWQRDFLASGQADEDLAYWRRQLAVLPEPVHLPSDRPRPEVPSADGALAFSRLSPELTARADALAQETGVTRFAVFTAVLHTLLARYCGTERVTVGAPFAGRDLPGTERSIGYYLNTLPLLGDLSGAPAFRQLLTRTRSTIADAYTHQRVPYGFLVERLGWAPAADHPYLEVCLVPEDIYRHHMAFAGIEADFVYVDVKVAKFDLTISLIPATDGGLLLSAEYRTDLFHRPRVERLLGHLTTLLDSATATPDRRVTQLPMPDAAEPAPLPDSFAAAAFRAPSDTTAAEAVTVHELVDRWATRTPDAPALQADGLRLTYRQLADRADKLAYYLAERGAGPGARVGLLLPRGADAVVAMLAVLRTGAAYVPLDPAFPEDRLTFMAQDAGLALTLTPDLLDDDREAIAASAGGAPVTALSAEDCACVLYTSGTTGRPKGILLPHRAVADLALGGHSWAGIDSGTRLLSVASFSFDMATFDVWATLTAGATLIVAPEDAVSVGRIASLVERFGITHGDMPTALFHRQTELDPSSLAGLSTLVVGGEVLDPALAAAVLTASPGLRLINGYGPTEATTYSTCHILDSADDVTAPVPIGRPTPGTLVRVLDSDGRAVLPGDEGELYLGGPGLALGYLNQPELTAERFIEDPYGAPGQRLYRTGDLCRRGPDGIIAYTGRTDAQLKLYGHRVEPAEIEAVLCSHTAVAQAVVVRREDRPGRPYLAAYYTMADDGVSPRELVDLAAARLPAYMVPRSLTELDSLPVTAGGKRDRTALPPPAAADHASARQPVHGGTADDGRGAGVADTGHLSVEEEIALIWRDVLGTNTLDPDDRLFDMGGASLHVAAIHQRVTERFGLTGLNMIDLFSHPTVRSYAAHVRHLCEREREGGDRP